MNFDPPNQEAEAIKHFRKLLKQWRRAFYEDNWPTTAAHLHELLQKAMIAEGADPAWIAFAITDPERIGKPTRPLTKNEQSKQPS